MRHSTRRQTMAPSPRSPAADTLRTAHCKLATRLVAPPCKSSRRGSRHRSAPVCVLVSAPCASTAKLKPRIGASARGLPCALAATRALPLPLTPKHGSTFLPKCHPRGAGRPARAQMGTSGSAFPYSMVCLLPPRLPPPPYSRPNQHTRDHSSSSPHLGIRGVSTHSRVHAPLGGHTSTHFLASPPAPKDARRPMYSPTEARHPRACPIPVSLSSPSCPTKKRR
ncbi:hypothetical protein B0H14DRAFT_3854090 [Mycena olivaceomarginata]|nr:hypothetical protein B0H14DRAFT_3854090 [Mycena olivaceomarginata]